MKSFLIEFTRSRHRLDFIAQGQPLPWARRERWARQLFECVCEAHSKGFVIGTLVKFQPPVIIEGTVSIQLWHFESKFSIGHTTGCYYTPEFQHYKHASKRRTKPILGILQRNQIFIILACFSGTWLKTFRGRIIAQWA